MGTKPNSSKVLSQRPRPKRARKQRPKAQKKLLSHYREALPTLREKGNSAKNPIDIDAFYSLFEPSVIKEYVEKEDISFARDTAPIKTESTFDLHAFDADGSQISFKIKAHHPLFLERIKQFFDHATVDYVQGMPRRFTDRETSILSVITYETLSTLGPDAIQEMFSSKNIVVTGCPRDVKLKFDSYGLRTLTGSMSTQISITDFSTMVASGDDQEPCVPSVLSGVVQDLLDNAEDTESSKILNALDFPLWDGSRDRNAYATDMAAWDVTRSLHIFDPSALYPTGDVRWGLAGLKNSMTFLHIDPDGFHTENTIGTSSTNFYLDDGFCLNEVIDRTRYDFEIIALRPGDRIYMRPNTPHFVFGTENSICYGGHFYSTLTMQQTLSGVVHSFMLDKFLTNTTHQASRQLLRRILVFYLHGLMDKKISTEDFAWPHLPNLDKIGGLMSLLSLCVLVILGNVLDFRTYTASSLQQAQPLMEAEKWLMMTYDINGIPTNERLAMCYTRGAALHLFRWVRECCVIHGPEGSVVEDLPFRFLTQIGRAMIHYKKRAEENNLEGVTHCSLDFLTSQINNVMESYNDICKVWTDNSEQQPDSLELKDQSKYRIEWRAGWESSGSWSSNATDYKNDGCTIFDLTYFNAQTKRVQAEHCRMTSFFGPD
ncbi:hypothetical protein HYPSUDRAFT_149642 [Hypholoma sublateritium FD-334 SS-4]|uniref:JmjC domain-containing protein n=1 Tax=Hypholoma sublateritium (strain FD-334 SS-4) TaxID=945553 RepID=A0A0D2LW03_HYPSF|nr:hypothetical protein HYPSUDRAFT_149642 [Hypholoma sublateritium FD-334 SS-4]